MFFQSVLSTYESPRRHNSEAQERHSDILFAKYFASGIFAASLTETMMEISMIMNV
jgi:hypothetical protein